MKQIHLTNDTTDRVTSAATIGCFDGVHRGHQYLIGQLKQAAQQRGLPTTVVTFDRPPRLLFQPDWQPQLLSTADEQQQHLATTGIDRMVVLHFDRQMAALSAHDFMQRVLKEQLGVELLLTGYDNRFGHDRTEGFDDYRRYGQQLGIDLVLGQPLVAEGETVSSTLVRRYLSEGNVERANQLLGYRYTLQGTIVAGEHIGHRLGFPTANLQLSVPEKMLPQAGAYAVRVATAESHAPTFTGMMNIGHRPTFDGHHQTIEIHILDFSGDLYGQTLSVELVALLRPEQRFANEADLKAQLQADAEQARTLIQTLI